MHRPFIIFFLCSFSVGQAQTIGGSSAYNFLNLPSSPLLTGFGGVNTSYKTDEVGLSANNPALLSSDLSGQLDVAFNGFLAGIRAYGTTAALQSQKYGTTMGAHIYVVDYGSIPQTDASGNINGSFHPVDYVIQLSAARPYLERWQYGISLKWINSNYQLYKSSALAMDFGLLYTDSSHHFFASVLARNMGMQLKSYAGQNEDLPFDLQVGITRRLENAPLGFSFTAQHMHQFNLLYNDADFNSQNNLPGKDNFFNKMLIHFVVAGHVYIGSSLEATIGYNHLRRQELSVGFSGNGLNGFSFGLRAKLSKFQVLFARSSYQRNVSYNQLGLTINLKELSGLGSL